MKIHPWLDLSGYRRNKNVGNSILGMTGSVDCHLQGAITKRMTAIEEMAGMDVLCSDKTGTLTLNKLTVDNNIIEVITPTTCIHVDPNCTCS
jgi:hypothetical protein